MCPGVAQAFVAKVMMVAQYGSIGLLLGGEQLFAALGMPIPELYQQYRDKRMGIVMGIWLLGNALQNQLVSTGAFEVYYDGNRVSAQLLHALLSRTLTLYVPHLFCVVSNKFLSLNEQVFSKLESGRVPSIDELIDLLEAAKGLPPSFEQRSRI